MTIQSTYGTWDSFTWPYPRVIYNGQQYIGFALQSTNLYVFEMRVYGGNWNAEYVLNLGTASDIVSVDVAGFGKYYLLAVETSSEIKCYQRDVGAIYGGTPLTEISKVTYPVGSTVCNFKGQILFGGIESNNSIWNELGSCSVAWSGIGNALFSPLDDPSAGFLTLPWDNNRTGRVYAIRRLGDYVVVYGNNGRALLTPYAQENAVGFGLKELKGPGIPNLNCVGGGPNVQCFIDQKHDVWIASEKPSFDNIGYSEWVDDLFASGNDIVISYSNAEETFYFSDGNYCFALTQYGMYSTNQCPTSVFDYDNTLSGLFYDNTDYETRLTFSQTDFGYRGLKTLETLDFAINHDDSDAHSYVKVDARYDHRSGFRTGNWIRLNDVGTASPIVTASDFKISFKGPDYTDVAEMTIEEIKSRLKGVDKRGIRGMYGN